MRIVFIGSTNFGMQCLKQCLKVNGLEVVGILTAPQNFKISYSESAVKNFLFADFNELAKTNNIPITILKDTMQDPFLFKFIKDWEPEAFLVAGWYHMIPSSWREYAPAYGLHASLLPKYSGGAPLVWAIINGENKTGITLFQMDDGVDSGPILGQKEELIFKDDTIKSLYKRIEKKGIELLSEILPLLVNGKVIFSIQDESQRTFVSQRSPEDGLIKWANDSIFIERFIRAQTQPYPGAFSYLENKKLKIWEAKYNKKSITGEYGKINFYNNSYIVSCLNGSLELIKISYDSKLYLAADLFDLLGNGGQILDSELN